MSKQENGRINNIGEADIYEALVLGEWTSQQAANPQFWARPVSIISNQENKQKQQFKKSRLVQQL